ncbi:MAG: aminopeptidase P family protein [Bacteroidaceae bacterium]|nr:aminopeptidase P family protein [Prevotellaceae bacterium]MDY2849723.1 aminopeptidase P family protein [Bacteroidaceae bacterium]
MFSKETYINRRKALKELVGNGLVIILGNNDSPANYPNNCYTFRQDSSFLYFFGAKRDGLAGAIDIDNDKEYFLGNDIDIDDIVWYGSVESIRDMADMVGVAQTAPFNKLTELVAQAKQTGQKIHFLPPYRHDHMILLEELLGIKPSQQKEASSMELIKAVVTLRSTKSDEEIKEIERACSIGFKMHTTAMKLAQPGVTEHFIGGTIDGIANALGDKVSFSSIVTMHGEILHGAPKMNYLEAGRLLLVDAGAETINNYCSDHTRTTPVSGKFTHRQRDIYTIVEQAHDLALKKAKPGVLWYDVHMDVCRLITNGLKDLGLMKGDTEEAVASGAHALFLPHGLGHMMGMDVHDMENLGQTNVGYDEEIQPSTQFGTASLRMGRRLQKGFVVTDEPGIYFIPDLIDNWKANNINSDFLNFDVIEKYKDFGGIRIEDDVLVTENGVRFLGKDIIPYHADDVEKYVQEFQFS